MGDSRQEIQFACSELALSTSDTSVVGFQFH